MNPNKAKPTNMKKQIIPLLLSALLLTSCGGVDIQLLDGQRTSARNPDNAKLTIGDTICVYRMSKLPWTMCRCAVYEEKDSVIMAGETYQQRIAIVKSNDH